MLAMANIPRTRHAAHASKKGATAAVPASSTTTSATTAEFYRPETWRPEESIGYLMKRIIATVADAVDHELAPTGLTSAQWVPLLKVYLGEASTVAELARHCTLDAGAMTRTLDRLEAKGLVKRVRSSEDRRVVNLELTDEGRATAQKIPAALCRVQNAHLRGFTEEEWKLLKGMLRRILDTALELQQEREQGNPSQ
jgi:DNA-binding MarR family transcriptional regulator